MIESLSMPRSPGRSSVDYAFINMLRMNLTGSIVGSVDDTQNLVNYSAEKNITPEVEVIPIDKVNEAYERVMNKDVKFRFVIDMSTLAKAAL